MTQARKQVLADLDSPRYFALLDRLEALVQGPPFTALASRPASQVIPGQVRRAWRRLDRAVARAAEAAPEHRPEALHDARKAAKRARYAGESVDSVFGKPARRFARRAEDIQELLGEYQDCRMAQARLRELGVQAHTAGENGYTFGLLTGQERARADEVERQVPAVWAKTSRPRYRRWLG